MEKQNNVLKTKIKILEKFIKNFTNTPKIQNLYLDHESQSDKYEETKPSTFNLIYNRVPFD